MRLQKARIEGYRSIRKPLEFVVEPSVTVIVGPNDHGKSNLLKSLLHLNSSNDFDQDDLNWDSESKSDELPSVVGTVELDSKSKGFLIDIENRARKKINEKINERDSDIEDDELEQEQIVPENATSSPEGGAPATPPQPPAPTTTESDFEDLPEEPLDLLEADHIPDTITLSRIGLFGELEIEGLEEFQDEVQNEFFDYLPRFELIEPITKLSDSVTAEELKGDENEFMRGIFYYAGINPNDATTLFKQNDRTQMQVSQASDVLNETLKQSWSQGQDLQFRLTHDSKEDRIDLQIQDPSVASRYVRASRRSSGFTHYFSLKTILHSRQKDHPANSYILLFDEPGLFLHLSGQYDLLQVLEALSRESQVLYVTHSLFMINKTFPTRHRLIMKSEEGTTINGKPYTGRWQSVLNALGLSLTGSILFANHVLLTEGDSDPIYIYAIVQKAVLAGKVDMEINSLAVMSTSESKNTDTLLRLLLETEPVPKIAVVCDGDKGGKDRIKFISNVLKDKEIPSKTLTTDTSIEDHVPMIKEIYVPAVAAFVVKVLSFLGETPPNEESLKDKLLEDFNDKFDKEDTVVEISKWTNDVAVRIGGLKKKPSKVGIAREYATRLIDIDNREFKFGRRGKALIEWLQKELSIPTTHEVKESIMNE
ncbi:ATP-dependent nuclease [Thalassoglobus polymorphus]|uniref:Chromosome partition protein Smc n=1 Tax=Thalassoglobus polymorphus TaxID=2527994 RepID=A0A517QRN9_9PLAN|nr:AAA family ATPase [Thalassoglobus polymorphus]QDT34278.1 Chromosome partition protein Smc [Thalassoglobus polymorphus]